MHVNTHTHTYLFKKYNRYKLYLKAYKHKNETSTPNNRFCISCQTTHIPVLDSFPYKAAAVAVTAAFYFSIRNKKLMEFIRFAFLASPPPDFYCVCADIFHHLLMYIFVGGGRGPPISKN